MGWIWYSGKACLLSGDNGDYLAQDVNMTPGTQYIVFFTVSGMSSGRLAVGNFDETHVISENGTYALAGEAASDTVIFTGLIDSDGDLFNGCIDSVRVFEFTGLEELACSPCINVQEELGGCLLVTAENDNTALNFNWNDLILKARIPAKFAKVEYDTSKESLDDNGGDRITTYFDGKKNRSLQVDASPVFIHDFLYMCMGVDTLKFNGVEYVIVDDNYPNITWNKSETEGTVELKVRKKNSKLNKTNCG